MENREVSSAKNLTDEFIPTSRSFIYTKKNNGPRTEPWGTPALILPHDDSEPFITTRCFRFLR